jgi:uncharacterized protein (DUF433 family)
MGRPMKVRKNNERGSCLLAFESGPPALDWNIDFAAPAWGLSGTQSRTVTRLLLNDPTSGTFAAMKGEPISRNPHVLGGTPVFTGTRVPVRNFVDCLAGGYSIDEFLEDFPTVRREQAIAVLEEASDRLQLASPA